MPDTTPPPSRFQDTYLAGTAPWVIGEPQRAVVDLERRGGLVGSVLDLGCGAGEHTLLLAARGYDVVGADAAPAAVDQARALAVERGVAARFTVGDALHPDGLDPVDTVLGSALFHVFAPGRAGGLCRGAHRARPPGRPRGRPRPGGRGRVGLRPGGRRGRRPRNVHRSGVVGGEPGALDLPRPHRRARAGRALRGARGRARRPAGLAGGRPPPSSGRSRTTRSCPIDRTAVIGSQ